MAVINNVDARQAMAIANRWKWEKKYIKTYVTAEEVIFKFPQGKIKKIPLPEDEMVVAVAPFINETHG